MTTTIINKNNVFGVFAKILGLLDDSPEIKISYEAGENEEQKTRFATRGARTEYPKKFTKTEDGDNKSYARGSFADRPKHIRGGSKFDGPTDDRAPKKTTNYKTSKFASKKNGDEKQSLNKKGNAGKGYKKAGY